MDCNPPGSSVHGILQARILEWVATSFSRVSSQPRDWTWVSCIARRFFTEEGDHRGWDGWMASLTRWTWVWRNSRSWWWTGRLGVLQFMESQKVGHNWATELSWTECIQDGKNKNLSYSISPSLLPVQSFFLPHFLLSFQQACFLSSPTHCLRPILLYTLDSLCHWPLFLILFFTFSCCCSVIQWCLTLWNSMDCSMPGFPVFYYLPKFAEIPVHWVDDAISQLFTSGGQSIGAWALASASVFSMNIQSWFPLGLTSLISLHV